MTEVSWIIAAIIVVAIGIGWFANPDMFRRAWVRMGKWGKR